MSTDTPRVVDVDGLARLIEALVADGREVIGPKVVDGAVVYEPIAALGEMPVGLVDEQDGGRYRLVDAGRESLFDNALGPHSWKRYLQPPRERLWRARRAAGGEGFSVEPESDAAPTRAFIGVRACELAAMAVQDRVFDNGDFCDPRYAARREAVFLVAVNCARPAATCFCTSMGTGPKARAGFDLALTELFRGARHEFLVEAGSAAGAQMLERLAGRDAGNEDLDAAAGVSEAAAAGMRRSMLPDARTLLAANREHPRWQEVAERCLACGNCTMVCPTCFCTTVEDTTSLDGNEAQRWRSWDSCFTADFSYIHGGSIRRSTAARYRQWLTHKLSTWHDQFETSGCVGCGRCIAWCPVGIDITEEVRAIGARPSGGDGQASRQGTS